MKNIEKQVEYIVETYGHAPEEATKKICALFSVSGSTLGTMDANCDHDIDKLYNKNGDYKGDYCKKCKGVY